MWKKTREQKPGLDNCEYKNGYYQIYARSVHEGERVVDLALVLMFPNTFPEWRDKKAE